MSYDLNAPWHLGDLEDIAPDDEVFEWRQQVVDQDGHEVGAAYFPDREHAQRIGRIFAAAPELLEAAEQAWRALLEREPHSVPGGEQACEALQVALAKARGLSS